jgi:hypothetical protein
MTTPYSCEIISLLFNFCTDYAGTEIATIEARDADSGDFGRVTYLLDRMSSQVIDELDHFCLLVCSNRGTTPIL